MKLTTCCGKINYGARIVGGSETEVNMYPWIARLSFMGRFFCAGSLINDRYVLTAAHCVKAYIWFMVKVTFGEHDKCNSKSDPESRFILRAITQPLSHTNYDNDIALLRLNDRVPINAVIRPICLPNRRASHYAGTTATVAGWGSMKEEQEVLSCVLRDVKVPILTNLECVHRSSYTSSMVTENMMCAGYFGGGKDSCQGNSGGPLMAQRNDKRMELAGIVSWGKNIHFPDYPGVYTRVTRYLNWIRQNTRDAYYCRNKWPFDAIDSSLNARARRQVIEITSLRHNFKQNFTCN
ncbi:trypsin-like [Sitodiplosis mosellana]|uniref:trypsin-like n=1 Tax=Sitodiplosis mosellana TaxID=263140 RepID=UPI002443FDAF|nr:trypsin-like [Sitodiplosis mosellana]